MHKDAQIVMIENVIENSLNTQTQKVNEVA